MSTVRQYKYLWKRTHGQTSSSLVDEMATEGFWLQLKALLWRNIILKKRNKGRTFQVKILLLLHKISVDNGVWSVWQSVVLRVSYSQSFIVRYPHAIGGNIRVISKCGIKSLFTLGSVKRDLMPHSNSTMMLPPMPHQKLKTTRTTLIVQRILECNCQQNRSILQLWILYIITRVFCTSFRTGLVLGHYELFKWSV